MAKRGRKQSAGDELEGLYGAPFDDFVSERDELAKRLRDEGDAERAAEVKKLRKPSRSVWAVNQGVRADAAAAKRLIKAGEDLEAAQGKALGGGGQKALRDAMSDQQEAVEHMMGAVESGTAEQGELSSAVLDRVRETLRAVAGDAELREEFAAGRVTRDRQAVGFGGAVKPAPSRSAAPRKAKPSAARQRKAEQGVKRAQRDLDTATKRVKEAQRRLARAQKGVEGAQQKLDEAEEEQRDTEAALEKARAALGRER
jgi:hypothetical protein